MSIEAKRSVDPKGSSAVAIINRRRRSLLFREADGKCFYCGCPVFEDGCHHARDWLDVSAVGGAMEREHKIPTTRKGGDGINNIVCACRTCNVAKGAFTLDEYRFLAALRVGDLNFIFPGEKQHMAENSRDWLICHSSEPFERDLILHNMPSAKVAYDLRRKNRRSKRRA